MSKAQHHICCNYHMQPIGGPGCICVITTKKEKKQLEEVHQIMQEWINQPSGWNYSKLFDKLATTLGMKKDSQETNP